MENYVLQKNDYEDISFLINISKKIKEIYNELNEIEINFGKDSDKYKEAIERLKSTLNLESSIYNRLKNDYYKCNAIIDYLTNSKDYKTTNNSYDLLLDETYDVEISRIIIKLNKYILEKSKISMSELEIENENVKNQLSNASNYALNLFPAMTLDTIKCLLAILKKDNLIDISTYMKYKISCLFPEMEQEFLDNNFEIDPNPYVSAEMYSNLFAQCNESLKIIRIVEFIENVNIQVDYFLGFSDFDLENSKIKNNLIVRMSFLRALLIFVDEDTIDKIYDNLKNFINTEVDRMYYFKNISELLCESFHHRLEDSEIPKILTIKKL